MHLSWQVQSLPRILCTVALLAQFTQAIFDTDPEKFVKLVNKVFKVLKQKAEEGIRMVKVSETTINVRVYSDSYFVNNHETTETKLGCLILLAEDDKNAAIIA